MISFYPVLRSLGHWWWMWTVGSIVRCLKWDGGGGLTLSCPGAQRPGWPNSQLPIRNLLSPMPKLGTFSFLSLRHLLALFWQNWSIRGQPLFSMRHPKNFEYDRLFLCLKMAEIDMGCKFWVKKNDSGHKNLFFKC